MYYIQDYESDFEDEDEEESEQNASGSGEQSSAEMSTSDSNHLEVKRSEDREDLDSGQFSRDETRHDDLGLVDYPPVNMIYGYQRVYIKYTKQSY